MAIQVVQQVNAGYVGTVGSGTITFPAATTAGNAVIVVIEAEQNTVASVHYASATGTAFTQVVSSVGTATPFSDNIYIFWLPSISGGSSSVYFTNSTSCQTFAFALEVSGLTGTVDKTSAAGHGTPSTSWSSGSITTSSASELLVGGVCAGGGAGGTITGPAGWVNIPVYTGFTGAGYLTASSVGSYAYSGTLTLSDDNAAVIASFPGSAGSVQPVGNPSGGPWTLVFDDEFNIGYPTPYGTGPNPDVWADHFQGGDTQRTNNTSEQEWYPHGYYGQSVANSVLTMTATYQNPQSVDPTCPNPLQSGGPTGTFTSAMISSHLGFAMTYGYFEARVQQPSPGSSWPAFWMLSRGFTWPPEIDIAEWQPPGHGGQDQLGFYNHSSTWQSTYLSGDENYHVWGCQVTSSTVTYYEDGVQVTSHTYDGVAVPWFVIFNYAIEGASGGSGYPANYNIDYFRAWTPAAAPASPSVSSISPATGIPSGGSVTVNFGAVAGATSYRVSAAPGFADADGDESANTYYQATGTSSPITVTGLTANVRYNVTVCAISSAGYSAESLPAGPQLINIQLLTTSLPGGSAGNAYSATLAAAAGVTPYTWAVSSGTLPAGLTLNSSTGVISGTPAGSGTSSFTVKVSGNTNWFGGSTVANSASQALSITITGSSPWTLVAQETFSANTLASDFVVYNNGTATSYEANSWMASQVSINTSTQELILNAKLSGGAGSERVGGALYWTGGANTPAIMQYGAWECDYSTQNQAGYAPVMLMWPIPDNGNWPQDGEIDIMEVYTTDTLTSCGQSNFHLSPTAGSSAHLMAPSSTTNSSAANVAAGNYQLNVTTQHTIRLEWQPTYIAVFVDGTQVSKTTDTTWIPTELPMRWTMQQEFYGVADSAISALNANTVITGLRAYTYTGGAPSNPALQALADNFVVNDLTALWYNSTNVTWSTGQVAVPVNTSSSGKLGATNAYNLTGSDMIAEVVPPSGSAYQVWMTLYNGTSYPQIGYNGGQLTANLIQSSVTSFTQSVTYDPVNHRWWRIRESLGTIYFDVSSVGVTWTNLWSTTYTMVITGVSPAFTGTASAGSATADVLNVGGGVTGGFITLAVGSTLTSGGVTGALGDTALPLSLAMVSAPAGYYPGQAVLAVSTALAPASVLQAAAELGISLGVAPSPSGWIYVGPDDVTYPQYLDLAGALTATPGEFTYYIIPASGYPYAVPVPPPDGKWLSLATGQVVALEAPRGVAVHPSAPAPLLTTPKRHGMKHRSAYGKKGAGE